MGHAVNASCKNAKLLKAAYLGLVMCALGALPMQVGAQEMGPPRSASDSGNAEQVVQRIMAALRSDRSVSAQHVEVYVEQGNIVLRGFVLDDSDRRKALRIARDISDRKVIDNIELQQDGQ